MIERKTALVAGPTGVVGREVVETLRHTSAYGQIDLLSRRAIPGSPQRVTTHLVDFEALCGGGTVPACDDVYICIGTTQKLAGSQDAFRRVDQDYVIAVAAAARNAGATRLALVSSVGAESSSKNFYLQVKGAAEDAVGQLGFEQVAIARPCLLRGPRENDKRLGESLAKVAAPVMDIMLWGGLKRFRSIYPVVVARALVAALQEQTPGIRVLEYPQLKALSGR